MSKAAATDPDLERYFDAEAAGWDEKYKQSSLFRMRVLEFERLLEEFAGGSSEALDFGCGAGNLTGLLRRHARRTTATDASRNMREAARARFAGTDDVEVVEPAALEPGTFDLVLCSSVIEYVEDDGSFLDLLRGLLREGGVLLISFPNRSGALQLLNRIVLSRWRRDSYIHYQKHVYHVAAVRRLVQEHGLAPEKVYSAIGLAGLRRIGFGELVLCVARRT